MLSIRGCHDIKSVKCDNLVGFIAVFFKYPPLPKAEVNFQTHTGIPIYGSCFSLVNVNHLKDKTIKYLKKLNI